MTTNVGGLIADIGLNVGMLRADIGKANAELSRGTAMMNRHLAGLQRQVNQAGNAFKFLVAGAGLGLLVRNVREAVQEVDGLAKAAKTADVTAESLQELRFAFGQIADVNDQEVDKSLQRFVSRLGDATTGNKTFAASFASLGVSVNQSTEGALDDALRSLGAIENDAVRAAKASDLFGDKIGPKLAQALRGGVSELDHMRQTAHDLGIVLSDELVANAEVTADQFDVLGRVMGTGFQKLVLDNAQTILTLANAFKSVAEWAFAAVGKIVDFTRAMGEIAGGAQGFGAEADVLQVQINSLKAGRIRRGPVDSPLYQQVEAEISRLQQQQLAVMTSGRNVARGSPTVPSLTLTGGGGGGGTLVTGAKSEGQPLSPEIRTFIENLERGEKLTESMRTEVEEQVDAWREAKQLFDAGFIGADTLNRIDKEQLQPIEVTAKRLPKILDDSKSQWQTIGKSMGLSLQDSLANAMLGIETNWKAMIKSMLAHAAVSGFLNLLAGSATGGFGKVLGFLGFGGGKSVGGSIEPGKMYRVHRDEWIVPSSAGSVVPAGAGGGSFNFNTNIDARGADPSVLARMGPMLDERDKRLMARIQDLRNRGRF